MRLFLCYLLFFVFFVSCADKKVEIDLSGLDNIDESIGLAVGKQYYLALVIGNGSCDLCDHYKREILKLDNSPKQVFFENLLIKSVDITKPQNLWINQVVREYGFPLTVIFDPDGNIKGFFRGANIKRLFEGMAALEKDQVYYRASNVFLNLESKENLSKDLVSDHQKIDFINSVYRLYREFRTGKEGDVNQRKQIDESIRIQPYFLNNYLLVRSMVNDRKEDASILAAKVLDNYPGELDDILYGDFKRELRSIAGLDNADVVGARIGFDRRIINFGEEKVGSTKTIEVPISNTGTDALFISNVRGSCTCLDLKWPRDSIKPQESGVIRVKYNLANRGDFNQSIFISSNSSPFQPEEVKIMGTVN
ncbi:DUF1573 domain-containing protein [Sphingobacterium paucimobilis]|uniref:DUF1573 domain-containing protein n=1 Tax=Sphingobacterium paucimobilis HER1398 TaxID=1346330 RepID=U2HEH6_9SPHI|nr:DUF1573 domain-containing protein [Sphingobacterium paucimobilis]ERJ60156.1 hypothetical protein M472_15440 [Sphingobacterium paucimobilis HER1398]